MTSKVHNPPKLLEKHTQTKLQGERERERKTNRSAEATLVEISSEQANCRDETTTCRLRPSISMVLFLSFSLALCFLSEESNKERSKSNIKVAYDSI